MNKIVGIKLTRGNKEHHVDINLKNRDAIYTYYTENDKDIFIENYNKDGFDARVLIIKQITDKGITKEKLVSVGYINYIIEDDKQPLLPGILFKDKENDTIYRKFNNKDDLYKYLNVDKENIRIENLENCKSIYKVLCKKIINDKNIIWEIIGYIDSYIMEDN